MASLAQPTSREGDLVPPPHLSDVMAGLPMELLGDVARQAIAQSSVLARILGCFCTNRVRFLASSTSVKRESLLALAKPNRPVCRLP